MTTKTNRQGKIGRVLAAALHVAFYAWVFAVLWDVFGFPAVLLSLLLVWVTFAATYHRQRALALRAERKAYALDMFYRAAIARGFSAVLVGEAWVRLEAGLAGEADTRFVWLGVFDLVYGVLDEVADRRDEIEAMSGAGS